MNESYNPDKDAFRLKKKIDRYKDEAWKDMNKVSGLDPKYKLRLRIWQALDSLSQEIDAKVPEYLKEEK